jgi:hypothetical protein
VEDSIPQDKNGRGEMCVVRRKSVASITQLSPAFGSSFLSGLISFRCAFHKNSSYRNFTRYAFFTRYTFFRAISVRMPLQTTQCFEMYPVRVPDE